MASMEIDINMYVIGSLLLYIAAIFLVIKATRKLVLKKLPKPPNGFGKIASFVFVGLSFFLLLFGLWLNITLREKEYNEYYSMAKSIGTIFAHDLSKEGHGFIRQTNGKMSAEYEHLLKKMTNWQNQIKGIQSVYTMRMDKNGQVYFVLSPTVDYNQDGRIHGKNEEVDPFGTVYEGDIPELETAFKGIFSMEKEPTTDDWGYSIGAFTPIFNDQGDVEAVVGIDFDGEQFIEHRLEETWKAFSLVGLIFLVSVLIYMLTLLSAAEKILLKKHQEDLNKMAYFDEFTGLPNRNFLTRLYPIINWVEEKVAVILFDFEGLDAINEILGVSKCDNVYIASIRRIQESLHYNMKLVRWSEREHLILVKEYVSQEEVVSFAEKLTKVFSNPIHIGGKDFYIAPNLGISFYPNDGDDWITLVKNADLAKSSIRSENDKRVMLYHTDLLTKAQEKRDLELELHHAILSEQFELYYQPQLSLSTNKVLGMEALIRWNHPTKGIISPLKFIQLAEELHLINQIGLWVLKKASSQTMELNKAFNLHLRVSVNVSSVQLQHPNFVQHLKNILEETLIEPSLLDLEITEGSLFNFEKSSQVLEDIKDLGVHISLDDFGAGYSSLSYLKKLRIHRLKIDRIFLTNIPNEEDTLMSSIVTLGHNLHLKVLAEGAETKEQVEFLKSIQCDEVQGYYFAMPLPYQEFVEYLRKQTG